MTGLDIAVHSLQRRSDQDVLEHLGGDVLKPGESLDALRLTMNYITLLERFLLSGLETVLFLEDDADFDINVRQQFDILAETMRRDAASRDSHASNQAERAPVEYPYGNNSWDILWLGHYGMEYTATTRITQYKDPYALPWSQLTSTYNNYYEQQRAAIPSGGLSQQQITYNVAPMSAYAWAVTRAHAEKLVRRLRDEHARIIDITLHVACKGLRQRCVAPVPELFHHQHVEGQNRIDHNGTAGVHDLAWWRGTHKYTYNVNLSARCNAAGVGERFGDRWKCLPGKYDDMV